MDLLSDLLRVIETVAAAELTPRIMPEAEHLISYHIVTEGRCFGGLSGEDQVELTAGDVLVFPHGDPHVMSSDRGLRLSPGVNTAASARYPHTVLLGDRGNVTTSFICGFLGCDRRPFNPLLAALPHRMHMRGMSTTWLGGSTRRLTEESQLGRPGAELVLTRVAEVMFIEVLRRYLDELPPGQTGWLAGLRDEVVGRALTLLHHRPAHPWTLAGLAHESASSRSSLAKRFAELVGQPPMQYLAQWRMQLAATLLVQSGAKVAAIADEVGYESEAAFSRAFKKATGLAPGAWREARRAVRT